MLEFPEYAKQYPPGWQNIIDRLVAKLDAIDFDITVLQAKSKFASLRFYTRIKGTKHYEDYIWKVVDKFVAEAEAESTVTCEVCGAKAELREINYFMVTLCDEHLKERLKNA